MAESAENARTRECTCCCYHADVTACAVLLMVQNMHSCFRVCEHCHGGDKKLQMHQYQIVGRRKPSEKNPNPEVFRMKLFAPNTVVARSRFWYYLSLLKKIKRINGEIVEVRELFEKKPTSIKNYGFWLRYDSRSGTHNMYKEFRDVSLTAAVEKMYATMASLHRARKSTVQIVRTAVVAAKNAKRPATLEYINNNIKFRLPHRVPRKNKAFRKVFSATKPTTFF